MFEYNLKKHVFIIGFMGTGKTTAARRFARLHGLVSIDTDAFVFRLTGTLAADIVRKQGEQAFREIETHALSQICNMDPAIVSCGGGLVTVKENRQIISKNGFCIYMHIDPKDAGKRISNKKSRPLLGDEKQASDLLMQRLPIYEQSADAVIDTTNRSISQTGKEIFKVLCKEDILVKA